ncbi:MAG TPA: SDR family oxidoreductase [Acidobacteriota bacterium]|nr:SDR family oxidoreductase [Acidobacteriota bacterium]
MSKSVLITGAGTGLGLETAVFLARKGYNVYATVPFREQYPQVEERAKERGCTLRVLHLDVTDDSSIRKTLDTILDQAGSIDVVINNAGISLRGYFEDCLDTEIRQVFEVNVFGAMKVTRRALPFMRRAGTGHLIYVSSIGGLIGSMARTAYCASKFAIEGFAESLSQEVNPFGIRVSIVEPAIIATERWTINRGIARNAGNPESPYFEWFQKEEELADRLVRSSPARPIHVAETIGDLLESRNPPLRRIVGTRAAMVAHLRRYLPGEAFERIFFSQAVKRVTGK